MEEVQLSISQGLEKDQSQKQKTILYGSSKGIVELSEEIDGEMGASQVESRRIKEIYIPKAFQGEAMNY